MILKDSKGRFIKGNQSGGRPFGYKVTEKTKLKISRGNKGTVHSMKTKFIWSKIRKGRKVSLETRLKMSKIHSGKNNPAWKGGISPINMRIRKSLKYTLWRESVFTRDKYTCKFCGQKGGKLQADHIMPFAYFEKVRFDLLNGRTLCEDCHKTTSTYLTKLYAPHS